jgi:type IV pilus assembly protein PilO
MADNAYTKLPRNQQLIVGVVAAVLIAGGFYYFWYADNVIVRDNLQKELAKLNAQVQELNAVRAQMPALEKEVEQLSLRLDQLKRILPPGKETPDLMKRLQSLASQANLKIRSVTPKATIQKEFYLEWPIEIVIDGSYANLGAFFDRVGRLPRIVNIGNLKTQAAARPTFNQTLAATYTATTYVYSEPPPAPPKPGKATKK